MREYRDAAGNVTGTSKGCQGGCATLFWLVVFIAMVVGSISALIHH